VKGITSDGVVPELIGRARKLTPDTRPRWGSLTARQMLCHVGDVVRLVVGDIPTKPPRPRHGLRPLQRFPLKHLFLYLLPWPHGVRGPKAAFTTSPAELEEDVKALEALLLKFRDFAPKDQWPSHPIFGPMTARDWNRVLYRHTDHHFRQFGI
jgi:Protein of unknown function (DUF1569)